MLGVLIGASANGTRYVEPIVDFIRAIPPVALVPVFILLLGLDSAMRIASIAFAASLGWGVAAPALPVGVWQGTVTILAALLGALLPAAAVAALTATGGVLLLGVGLRLLQVRAVPVGDMLPALILAPAITMLIARG